MPLFLKPINPNGNPISVALNIENLPPIGEILKNTENNNYANIAPQKGGIAYVAIPNILAI